jgi:hypothetical protein
VTWSSRKLAGIATSSTIAEYKSLSEAAKEAVWLRQLLGEIMQQHTPPLMLLCDNQSAIKISLQQEKVSARTKHLKVSWHYVRNALEEGEVKVDYVPTRLQDADLLTKAQDGPRLRLNRTRIGLQVCASPSINSM